MMIIQPVVIVFLLGMFGCSRATYIRATVTDNPLGWVEQQAQADWSIKRVDANTLYLSEIFRWSGASMKSRRDGKLSETFPPQKPILLPP